LILRYLKNPVELIGETEIKGVTFEKMRLEGPPGDQKAVPKDPKEFTQIPCDLLIKSIGFKSKPIQGIPFDSKTCTVPHSQGCVLNEDKQPIPGLYVSGWLKRGPVGIIDSTLRDSVDTFRIIKHHLECDLLQEKKYSVDEIKTMLENAGLSNVVDYESWQSVDKVERERGEVKGKTREKILNKDEMLKLAISQN